MSNQHLSEHEVVRIAGLARIAVTDQRVAETAAGLERVLGFVDQLQEAKVDGVEPTSQVTGLVDVLRPDEVHPSPISREEFLQRAPAHEKGYIKVKRVMK